VTPGAYLEESTFKVTLFIHLRELQIGTFKSKAIQVNFTFYFLVIKTI